MPQPQPPSSPRLFLIDGYALIYRAFFALISRPLTTSRGENTSAAFGIATFLQRLQAAHAPEYLGWVHDSGLSFRHERYPAYKATRQKLSDELQSDFDRGMERIAEMLGAFRVPVLAVEGYEADDVIGTLARQGAAAGVNVVVVSADKDFQQLVRPGVWLLNPGRGGSAAVEEQWVSVENAGERLGVEPALVTDYLALVGDSSDNVPGVPGIGDKTARDLVQQFGPVESILAHAAELQKKRPREALLDPENAARARLSKELVTIRDDLPITLELDRLRVQPPDVTRLRPLFVELEFHNLARDLAPEATVAPERPAVKYETVDTVKRMREVLNQARQAPHVAIAAEAAVDFDSPSPSDPLRSTLVSLAIAVAPGEAFYLPLRHRSRSVMQGELLVDIPGDRAPTDAREDRGLVMGGDEAVTVATVDESPEVKPARRKKAASSASRAEPDSIAARMLARGKAVVRNLPALDSDEMAPLREFLEDPAVLKVAQNAKFDVLAFRRAGIEVQGLTFDTMLASYVLDPGRRSHGIDVLALEFLDHRVTSFEELCGRGKTAIPFEECPIDCARDYACEDADMTLQLRERFASQLEAYDLMRLFQEIEMPLVEVLARMESEGVSIDLEWFRSLKARFKAERQAVEREIHEIAGMEFNINSNLQLREILFDKLKLPVLKRTSTGPSTDASVLQELAEQGHQLPQRLMEYRELSKLENTYLDTLPALVHPETRRLHTSFNQTVATTGRLSSSDPNLQNIPIRRELGRDIRRGFIPRQGWRLLAADYSQIELRLLAHLSNDPAFVDAFRAGGDIHRQTAAIIFGVPVDSVSAEMRGRAKTINFATICGQGAHALSRQLRIEFAEARAFIAAYFERFQGIRRYLDSMIEFAREHGYVQTIFGRRRYIPELRDRNFNVRAFGERTAANSPIQGSAADLIKIAMIRIDSALRRHDLQAKMLLQVHDELVFEAPPEEIDSVGTIVQREMEQAAVLSVPLVVDIGVGDNWMETKE
ncbi:MAG TPA: DNA polymerase I [Gemmatimonadaceae bacterium]|nr:DNA polymerase I [Gemmatimonadaceae bacterium]